MPRGRDLSSLDLAEISGRALIAAAAALADGARRRTLAAPGAITYAVTRDYIAMIWVTDPALVRRERGDPGLPPAPFLAPDAADRQAVRAAIVESLRKDLT